MSNTTLLVYSAKQTSYYVAIANPPPYCMLFFYSHFSRLLAGIQPNGAEAPGAVMLNSENSTGHGA